MSELKWYSVRWGFFGRRIFRFLWISACVALQVCIIGCVFVFCLLMIPFELFSKTPPESPLFTKPVPLVDQKVAQIKGIPFEAAGFAFVVPWHGIDHTNLHPENSAAYLHSDDHKVLHLDGNTDPGLFLEVSKQHPVLSFLEGVDTKQSQYSYLTEILNTTPDQSRWWMSRRTQLIVQNTLLLKDFLMSMHSKIESIQLGQMRGYQYSGGKLGCNYRKLDLYDAEDRSLEITYIDSQTKSCDEIQEMVNAIVASMRPLPQNK